MPTSSIHLYPNFFHFLDLGHTSLNEPSLSKWYRACEQTKSKSRHVIFLLRGNLENFKLFYTDISQSRRGFTTTLYWFLTRNKYIAALHCWTHVQANKYLLKFNNRNPRKWYGKCPKLKVKNLELYHWRRSCAFIVKFEYISYNIFQYIYFICWDLQIRFLIIKRVPLFFYRSIICSFSPFKRIVTIKDVFFLYSLNKLWS